MAEPVGITRCAPLSSHALRPSSSLPDLTLAEKVDALLAGNFEKLANGQSEVEWSPSTEDCNYATTPLRHPSVKLRRHLSQSDPTSRTFAPYNPARSTAGLTEPCYNEIQFHDHPVRQQLERTKFYEWEITPSGTRMFSVMNSYKQFCLLNIICKKLTEIDSASQLGKEKPSREAASFQSMLFHRRFVTPKGKKQKLS